MHLPHQVTKQQQFLGIVFQNVNVNYFFFLQNIYIKSKILTI